MHKHQPRYFIGLDLDAKAKLAIDQWRHKYLAGLSSKPVPMENFHITLSFLGCIHPEQREQLDKLLTNLSADSISCQLGELGAFKKAKILYLGIELSPELEALAEKCISINQALNVPQPHSQYRPHITLFRKHAIDYPVTAPKLDYSLAFNQFHLFESVSSSQPGKPPHYPKRQSFNLVPKFAHHQESAR